MTHAIAIIIGVEHRLEALLWHFATAGGASHPTALVPLALSHRLLAELVGARRPTVSTVLIAPRGPLEPQRDLSITPYAEGRRPH